MKIENFKFNSRPFFVIAHNIRSAHNVGSVFRTADAFGITKIFLTGYTPAPNNAFSGGKISKTALGAEKFVAWEKVKSTAALIKKLRKDCPKINIIALENNIKSYKPISLEKFKPKFPLALILGEETKGIEPRILKLCDQIVEIPMAGKKESLNVSVAFGVAAFALMI